MSTHCPIAILTAVSLAGGLAYAAEKSDKLPLADPPPAEHVQPERLPDKEIIKQVDVEKTQWQKGGFGSVLLVSTTIVNRSDYDVKDVVIGCVLVAPSGTLLGFATHTAYEAIPAHSEKRLYGINMGFIHSQTHKVGCIVKDAVVGEKGKPKPVATKSTPVPKSKGIRPGHGDYWFPPEDEAIKPEPSRSRSR